MVDLAARDITMAPVPTNQPLTSIEAFALALVEASSRLNDNDGPGTSTDDDVVHPLARDEALAPAVE